MTNRDVFNIRNEAKKLNGQPKISKLLEGLDLAHGIFQNEDDDEWTQKALAWVLIDLTKEFISVGRVGEAQECYNELINISFLEQDDIISSQISFLRPKIDINYTDVRKAEDLSKGGKHSEAIFLIKKLLAEGKLQPLHHEAYGWIIYRYLKAEIRNLDSISVRTHLRDYMNLKNERPSMLHSMILNFGLNYSKESKEFDLYKFFLLWNPEYLRYEDKIESYVEDQRIPSLVSRLFREIVEKEYQVDLKLIVEKVVMRDGEAVDLIREPFFWKLYNLHKEARWNELWHSFDKYLASLFIDVASEWHSKILSIAERYMTEGNACRFYGFFRKWNPKLLRETDWEDVAKDEKVFNSIGVKALKKAYEHVKSTKDKDVKWLIDAYGEGIKHCPNNEWLKREKGLLHAIAGESQKAVSIYRELSLDLFDKPYFWSEFSSLLEDEPNLRMSMLCYAALLEKNEDFLGEVRLSLAEIFISRQMSHNAGVELKLYKDNRLKNGWRLSERFEKLATQISLIDGNNLDLYRTSIGEAEEFAFSSIPWSKLVLVDLFQDKKNKQRLVFSDGQQVEITVSRRFIREMELRIGNPFEFKLKMVEKEVEGFSMEPFATKRGIKQFKALTYRKTNEADWSGLEDGFAIVDYINEEKGIIHAITFANEEIFLEAGKGRYSMNDILKGKVVKRFDRGQTVTRLVNASVQEDRSVLNQIEPKIALVDGVNNLKQVFHFLVSAKIDGIVKFSETELRPTEGDFIEVRLLSKYDKKKGLKRYKVAAISLTDQKNPSLMKEVTGEIHLKYKAGGRTRDYFELNEEELSELEPDFAFVLDYYVPKSLLSDHGITSNCNVAAKAIFCGEKWKVIDITKIVGASAKGD